MKTIDKILIALGLFIGSGMFWGNFNMLVPHNPNWLPKAGTLSARQCEFPVHPKFVGGNMGKYVSQVIHNFVVNPEDNGGEATRNCGFFLFMQILVGKHKYSKLRGVYDKLSTTCKDTGIAWYWLQ